MGRSLQRSLDGRGGGFENDRCGAHHRCKMPSMKLLDTVQRAIPRELSGPRSQLNRTLARLQKSSSLAGPRIAHALEAFNGRVICLEDGTKGRGTRPPCTQALFWTDFIAYFAGLHAQKADACPQTHRARSRGQGPCQWWLHCGPRASLAERHCSWRPHISLHARQCGQLIINRMRCSR